ncbi:Uncharacterised protein [Mycobacterium tuberculosis]|uniref:Uncharacterized protein n=1 Tax=Mycobacterium tuberculosis TaxID=1773 RepID=A0A916P9C7_MYCTX|nr:Uncharacterised protein [Mycobacterium tuberculosis]COZ83202.1 Uncharacterised protein [Mycobacterium tuberculosis]
MPTGIVVNGLPVKTSSIVLVGRAATSLIAARLRKRSKTSAEGAGISSPLSKKCGCLGHRVSACDW